MKKLLKEPLNSLVEEREIIQYPPCPDCGSEDIGLGGLRRGQQQYRCSKCLRHFSNKTKEQPRRTEFNNPPCPDCGSLRVHKRGINVSTGDVKYTCYECLRNFINFTKHFDNSEIEKPLSQQEQGSKFQYPPCPDCGSGTTRSLGYTKTGERKYRCNNCWRRFQDSTKHITKQQLPKELASKKRSTSINKSINLNYPPCPDCSSRWIRRKGICPQTKEQKYYWNDCQRLFTESTKNKPRPVYPPCQKCSSHDVTSMGKRGGKPYYRCKSCLAFLKDYKDDPPCPDCGSFKIRKAGTRRDQQQYNCKNCDRFFSESTKDKPKDSPRLYDFEADIWDLREFGIYFPPSTAWFTANFTHVLQPWLKVAAKHFIKHSTATLSGSGCAF